MPTGYNDQELITKLRENDVAAFDALYQKYHQSLYSYIHRFIKVPEMAEDILQEVFLKIWEIRSRLNPSLSFQAYVYRITRNSVYKLLKKMATEDDLQLAFAYHLSRSVQDDELQAQWRLYEEMLQEAIRQLPPQRQRVFRLCNQDGKKYDEVGKELNLSRNTVKEHMVMATKFLKEYIQVHYKMDLMLVLIFLSSL